MKDKELANDRWKIALIKKTGELVPYQPTKRQRKPKGAIVIASFISEEDMMQYMQAKKIDIGADGIAYIIKEHEYLSFPQQRLSQALNDLAGKVALVKEDSSRTCFGNCQSLDRQKACAICFRDLHETWELCATIKAIQSVCSEKQEESLDCEQ